MKCYKNLYTTNDVVIFSRPLVCYGGFGQLICKYLEKCLLDNGYKIITTKTGKRKVKNVNES